MKEFNCKRCNTSDVLEEDFVEENSVLEKLVCKKCKREYEQLKKTAIKQIDNEFFPATENKEAKQEHEQTKKSFIEEW